MTGWNSIGLFHPESKLIQFAERILCSETKIKKKMNRNQ